MPGWLIVVIVIGVIGLLIVGFLITNYNSLVSLRNKVKDQWAQIEVQLKRRFDLIPNLVETVKGYATHEKETLENVIKARNEFVAAKTPEAEMKASGELTNVLSKLFALSENYPDLKANANFIQLQADLKETEDKIAFARQFYNDGVLQLNNKVEMFPSNIVAGLFHFEKAVFFEVAGTERENVKVQF